MEVGPLLGQCVQMGAVPLAGVAAVHQFHLRVFAQIPVKPAQGLVHAHPVGAGKAGEVGARHAAQFGHLLVGHAGVAEAGNVQVQLLVRVQPELAAHGGLILEVAVELRAQKIHHHRAGHGGVFGLHAVGLQAFGCFFAPAGLHAFFGVSGHVEPVAFLLRVAEHLLPVQIHHPVTPADVVVHMAV